MKDGRWRLSLLPHPRLRWPATALQFQISNFKFQNLEGEGPPEPIAIEAARIASDVVRASTVLFGITMISNLEFQISKLGGRGASRADCDWGRRDCLGRCSGFDRSLWDHSDLKSQNLEGEGPPEPIAIGAAGIASDVVRASTVLFGITMISNLEFQISKPGGRGASRADCD